MKHYLLSLLFISSFISGNNEIKGYIKTIEELAQQINTQIKTLQKDANIKRLTLSITGLIGALGMGLSAGFIMEQLLKKTTFTCDRAITYTDVNTGVSIYKLATTKFNVFEKFELIAGHSLLFSASAYLLYLSINRLKTIHTEYLQHLACLQKFDLQVSKKLLKTLKLTPSNSDQSTGEQQVTT